MSTIERGQHAWLPSPDDPWYPKAEFLHRERARIVRSITKTTPEPDATWQIVVLDRAFYECFEYTQPDVFAGDLRRILTEALELYGTKALDHARSQIRERALALAIPEREW